VGVFQIWLYAHYELKCCAINICPVNIVGTDSQSVLIFLPVQGNGRYISQDKPIHSGLENPDYRFVSNP